MKQLTLIVFFAFVLVALYTCAPTDDTDPPSGRSGMGLRIDYRTGCHYLTSANLLGESAITPRLNQNGHQICDRPRTGSEVAQ